MTRKALFLAACLLGIQTLLSGLVFTPAPHTGGDNAGYVALAHSLVERGTYQELWTPGEPPHTKYPPVFPLLLAGAIAMGVKSWVGLKVVPFVSTLLVGLLSFLWVRDRKGDGVAFGVALLVALSDAVLYYSRWILSDPTFMALTLGALWALERGERREARNPGAWLLAGFALVLLAFFTRSAGLPLVVATLVWLILRRGWGGIVIFSLSFLGSAGLWWLRGRESGGSAYVSEFWLLDPYQPDLGTVGFGGLAVRVWENAVAYATRLVPEGIVGLEESWLPAFGLGVAALALVGWVRRVRVGPGLGDLFFPLYGGLMLLWPQVWSGDRFALPLLPFLFFYAATALLWVTETAKPAVRSLVMAVAFLAAALPSLGGWAREAEAARSCRALGREGDPWSCYGVNVREYVAMADWAGRNLPVGAVVVTRKPRIFFVQSSVKALSLPLTAEPRAFLAQAADGGARYLTADRWDGLAAYYLTPVVGGMPESFCAVTWVETGGERGIQLLGILPDGGGGSAEGLPVCPEDMVRSRPWPRELVAPGEIPLLVWGHRTR